MSDGLIAFFKEWVVENCVLSTAVSCKSTELYEDYCKFLPSKTERRPRSQRLFSAELLEFGLEKRLGSRHATFEGIRLSSSKSMALKDKIQIESNVPIPNGPRRDVNLKYPFGSMVIGDSFLADNRVSGAASSWKHTHPGWNYCTERQPDGSIRIWRTA
jgi:hypothetical protein